MTRLATEDLVTTLEEIRLQLADLAKRLSAVERLATQVQPTAAAANTAQPAPAPAPAAVPPVSAGISEDEVLAISAAVAAFLGLHAHIRQIRLIRSGNWALQGRATIQASHILNH